MGLLQGLGLGVVSVPICASNLSNSLASADQGYSIASQGSCNVHSTLAETTYLTPLKMDCTN